MTHGEMNQIGICSCGCGMNLRFQENYVIANPTPTRHAQALARIEEEVATLEKEIAIQELLAPIGYTPDDLAKMPRLKTMRELKKQLSAWQTLKVVLELHKPILTPLAGGAIGCNSCVSEYLGHNRNVDFPCPTADLIIKGVLGE